MDKKKHTHGFRIPEGYMDSFEDRLFSKIGEEGLPKETGFNVPEGYFDSLEDKVMSSVTSEKEETRVISLFSRRNLIYATSIAAGLALLITIVTGGGDEFDLTNELDKVSDATIENYLDEGNEDIDAYYIASLFDEEALSNVYIESDLFNDESLENYLLENLDESDILIE